MYTVLLSVLVLWSFLLSGLVICLFFLEFRQSSRTRELQRNLAALKKEIKILKRPPAEPAKAPYAESPDQAPEPHAAPAQKTKTETVEVPAEKAELREESPIKVPAYTAPEKPRERPEAKKETASAKSAIAKKSTAAAFNWENFLGAKLFAWIGGFSLFIGFLFLLKYSFDHNLISPAVRVALGFICGAGLVGGGIHLKRKTYEITAQTLCATGTVILYASNYAANSIYHFFGDAPAFILMSLITAGAFLLAAAMNARVIAILGLFGGFLTPPLLSTLKDQPFALFSYVTFLNVGLFLVAFYRKWNFLTALGAIGTILMQFWWSVEFFSREKVYVAMAIYLWFCALYCGAFWYGKKIKRSDAFLAVSASALPFVTFVFTLSLLSYQSIGLRPGVIYSYLLGADLCLLALALMDEKLQKAQLAAGGCVFFILSLWIGFRMTSDLLVWALTGSLVFALLHSAFPLIASRINRSAKITWHTNIFPLLALFLTLIPVVKGYGDRWVLWHFVLLFNAGILVLALYTASARAILGALAVTGIVLFGWVVNEPARILDSAAMVILVGSFGILFSVVVTFILRRLRKNMPATEDGKSRGIADLLDFSNADSLFLQIPILSSVLPFMLLMIASGRIEILNPASIFGVGLLLTAIAIGLARFLKMPFLLPVAMGSFFLLEVVVHLGHFNPDNAAVFLEFYFLATAVFFSLPFIYRLDYLKAALPWATAAMSGPLHFFLIYDAVKTAYPNDVMGLLPAVMAVPFFFGLANLVGWIPKEDIKRDSILAWFGGSTLFFITLIFPIQFDHQWLTIGWALEGAALIWLFKAVPHPGLRGLGVALLVGTFVRLGMNPAILLDYPQSTYPVFNWYLYTYSIAIFCLMAGGRMLAPPRNRVMGFNTPPVLYTLGTILAFIVMNIEIADFFSTGMSLRFQFSGDLARGMTYSIAWALFALGLIVAGIRKNLRPVRVAAIGLIGVTLMKLFFFDLSRLDQLYRIGAFIGVAIVLIAASALYQKWVVRRD